MKIEEKSKCKLIVFNIKDFYLSIKETLLIKAKNSAKNCKHNKRRQRNYKTCKEVSFMRQ